MNLHVPEQEGEEDTVSRQIQGGKTNVNFNANTIFTVCL